MRGDEAKVVQAFVSYLEGDGWDVETEVKWVDVVATRGKETLYGEAKGLTSAPGLDINTLYGQLLTRMTEDRDPHARYAVIVREQHKSMALRVPHRVRDLLEIEVYVVAESGHVNKVG